MRPYAASKARRAARLVRRVMAVGNCPPRKHSRQRRRTRCDPHADLGAALATPEAEKGVEARIGRSTPLGRIGEPDHVSKTVLVSRPPTMPPIFKGQELFVEWRPATALAERRADLSLENGGFP